ncbi:MAG TPA: hypothetical protein VKO38_02815 [Wenzhouxiangella sp.]|nr:hypothetical protein [Wenzhouxiangella sp.]
MRASVRKQYNIFKPDPGGLASIADQQAMTFTHPQVAAIVRGSSARQVATLDECPFY